jgi:hypothetical protein
VKNTDRREFLKLMGMTTLATALDANIAVHGSGGAGAQLHG